jgi:hypothetical protein
MSRSIRIVDSLCPPYHYSWLVPALPNAARAHAFTITHFDGALQRNAGECDLRELTFVDAYGLVGTACALRMAFAEQPGLPIHPPSNTPTARHLTSMGLAAFLEGCGRDQILPASSVADAVDVVVPLRSARDSGGAQALSHLLWQQARDHVDPSVLDAISEGVWEMVGNALEHSGSDALIMGQVYRRGVPPDHDDCVQVVIGDTGRGIRGSFSASGLHSPATDADAINLALEYLVSSVDDPGRGQGLSTTMEQVVGLNGRMVVRSGTAKVSITANERQTSRVTDLAGVIVALSLPLYPGRDAAHRNP